MEIIECHQPNSRIDYSQPFPAGMTNPLAVAMYWIDGGILGYDHYRDKYIATGDEWAFSKMLDNVRI